MHAKEITPYAEIDATVRELCDDLVFNRRPDALTRVIEHFESRERVARRRVLRLTTIDGRPSD